MVVIDRVSDDPYMSAAGIYDVHKIETTKKRFREHGSTKQQIM